MGFGPRNSERGSYHLRMVQWRQGLVSGVISTILLLSGTKGHFGVILRKGWC